MDDEYTGFRNCKYVVEFENELKLKRIMRKNTIKQSTEAILDPGRFLEHITEIRSQLKYRQRSDL